MYIAVVNAIIGGALVLPIMKQFKPAAAEEEVVDETPVDETEGYYWGPVSAALSDNLLNLSGLKWNSHVKRF